MSVAAANVEQATLRVFPGAFDQVSIRPVEAIGVCFPPIADGGERLEFSEGGDRKTCSSAAESQYLTGSTNRWAGPSWPPIATSLESCGIRDGPVALADLLLAQRLATRVIDTSYSASFARRSRTARQLGSGTVRLGTSDLVTGAENARNFDTQPSVVERLSEGHSTPVVLP